MLFYYLGKIRLFIGSEVALLLSSFLFLFLFCSQLRSFFTLHEEMKERKKEIDSGERTPP